MDHQNKLPLQKLLIAFIIAISMAFISCGDNAPQDPSKFSNTKKVEKKLVAARVSPRTPE